MPQREGERVCIREKGVESEGGPDKQKRKKREREGGRSHTSSYNSEYIVLIAIISQHIDCPFWDTFEPSEAFGNETKPERLERTKTAQFQ